MKLVTATDGALIASYARTRDRHALTELVERRWPEAYRIALRLLDDPASAEDAAQEAFVALVRESDSFDPGRAFDPWFRTIVLNSTRKHARARRTRASHEGTAASRRPETTGSRAEDEALASELRARIPSLPPQVREPIVLHFYEGLSYEEIAAATGSKKPTVQSRIRSGLEQLRSALAGTAFACTWEQLERALPRSAPSGAAPTAPSVALLEAAARKTGLALVAKLALVAIAALGLGVAAVAFTAPRAPLAVPGIAVTGSATPAAAPTIATAGTSTGTPPVAPAPTETASPPTTPPRKKKARPTTKLHGRVVAERGPLPAGTRVAQAERPDAWADKFVVDERAPGVSPIPLAADGSFDVELENPRFTLLRAWAPGHGIVEVGADESDTPILVLPAGARLTGRAVGKDGLAAPGARVVLTDRAERRVLAFARADREGRFALHAAGDDARIRADLDERGDDTIPAPRPGGPFARDVTVPRSGDEDVGDLLARPLRSRISGHVFGPGAPLSDARVWLLDGATPRAIGTDSQGDGSFAFTDLPQGKFTLLVTHEQKNLSMVDPRPVEVTGEDQVTRDVTLAPAGSISGSARGIRSIVAVPLRLEGAPAQFAAIDPKNLLPARFVPVDRDGRFVVRGLAPGRYKLLLDGDADRDVTVEAGRDTTVESEPTRRGRIEIKATGIPASLAGEKGRFRFRLHRGSPSRPDSFQGISRRSESNGAVTFDDLEPGIYTVGIEVPANGSEVTILSRDLDVIERGSVEAEIAWPDPATFGAIEGKLAPGVKAKNVIALGDRSLAWGRVGPDGAWKVAAVPAGAYRIFVQGSTAEPAAVAVEAGKTTRAP